MVRGHLRAVRRRTALELRRSVEEPHTPAQTAASFAFGTFVTMLPTLGFGLLLFVAVALVSDSVNKVALFAAVVVFNPVVKWGVYVASIALGMVLLGPIEVASVAEVTAADASALLVRLWVGNLVLAAVATGLAYVAAYRVTVAYRTSTVRERLDASIDDLLAD